MSEFKQENGYNRAANVSAKPLSGAVPGTGRVMDWSKGDLKSLFLAPAAKEPVTPKATVTAAKLDTATPDKQTPQQDKPHAVKAEAATIDDDKQPEQGAVEAVEPKQETPKVKQPIVVPPQFAPVVAAGVLSSNQRAMAHAKPEDMEPESNFEFQLGKGGEAGRRARHQLAELERHIENDSGSDRNNAADLAEQYLAEQQQRAFMQSMEYAVALDTVNNQIRELEIERDQTRERISILETRREEINAEIGAETTELEKDKERRGDLEDLKKTRDQNKEDEADLDSAYNRNEEIRKEFGKMQDATLKLDGKDVIMTVMEDGKPVKYRVGEDGQKQKLSDKEAGGIYDMNQMVLYKKTPDGQIKYVNMMGFEVSAEEKKRIDKALADADVKAEDVLPDRDKLIALQDAALEQADQEGVGDSALNKKMKKADESRSKLQEQAAKLGLSPEDIPKLEEHIKKIEEKIKDREEYIERLKAEGTKTDAEIKKEEKKLEILEAKLKESTDFRDRLQKGEFKNADEMKKAMPTYMREAYEANLENKKATAKQEVKAETSAPATIAAKATTEVSASPVAKVEATTDNTSRVNGSAAEPTVTASAKLGPPFAAAASGAPAAPTPEEPAPAPEMVAANQQQRNNLAGARLG